MIRIHQPLHLAVLTRERHERTCGYWYTLVEGSLAHTAFRTRAGLERWLAERGLALTAPLTEPGTWSHQAIAGAYREEWHLTPPEVEAWRALADAPNLAGLARTLSNGDHVEARLTDDPAGIDGPHAADRPDVIRTVHTLNPNVRGRHVFNPEASRAYEDGAVDGADHLLFPCPDGMACADASCRATVRLWMRDRDDRIVAWGGAA